MEKMLGGHHEVAIFQGTVPEAEESAWGWQKCEKNPGHEIFIPVPDFVDNYLPRIQDVEHREKLKGIIDRTVRLRVNNTSLDRPEGDDISDLRGKKELRVGTGWIHDVSKPVDNKPSRCFGCKGKVTRRHWKILVRTALHVVYNTEEAKETKVDLFYDDTYSNRDGRMKSLWGLEVVETYPDRDTCDMMCVTCDEDLVEKIKHACSVVYKGISCRNLKEILYDLGLLPSCNKDFVLVLIVSHPHSQPKQITVGKWKYRDDGSYTRQYTTPTCPGSSGAPVVVMDERRSFYWFTTVHSGSYGETSTEQYDILSLLKRLLNKLRGQETQTPTQLNYGHVWF